MDFSKAQNQRDFSEMVPEGTLCRGIFNIQPFNADAGIWETPTKKGDGKLLRVDITIIGGKHNKRHIFDNINTENPNPVASDIGRGSIKAILECSRGATPENAAAYSLDNYGDLNGAEIVFKVGVEPANGPYPSKNTVALYLSPLQTEKDWARFLAGDMDPDPNALRRQHAAQPAAGTTGGGAAPGASKPRWSQGEGAAGAVQAPDGPAQTSNPTTGAMAPTTGVPDQAQPTPAAPAAGGAPAWLTQGKS